MTTQTEEPKPAVGSTESKIVIQTLHMAGTQYERWTDVMLWDDVPGAIEEAQRMMDTPVRPGGRTPRQQGTERLTRQVTVTVVLD